MSENLNPIILMVKDKVSIYRTFRVSSLTACRYQEQYNRIGYWEVIYTTTYTDKKDETTLMGIERVWVNNVELN